MSEYETKLGNWLIIVWLVIVVLIFLGHARRVNAEPWSFEISNDWAVPYHQDRWLSNEFRLAYSDWALGQEMYTPTDKRSEEVDTGDHPWAGYSYLEYTSKDYIAFGEYWILKSRLGLVGERSGAEALQQFIHDDLGMGAHPTWSGQNPSEPTIDFIYSRLVREYVQSIVGDTSLEQEYGIRFGTVNDSVFLQQTLKKHFGKYFYPYVALRGEGVVYDTHLEGRLFQSNNYTVDAQYFVATARAGIELYFPESDWFVDYHYDYKTETFDGQQGRHSFGSLSFGRKF